MKSRTKILKELVLLTLPVILMIAIALHFQRLAAVSGRLVGTWSCNSSTNTWSTTFDKEGYFEDVVYVGSQSDGAIVSKGRYADSGNTFRTYNIKSYIRRNHHDFWVEPCDKGNESACSENHEATDMDKELSKPKYFFTIVSADWQKGILKVRDPVIGQYGGTISTWTRQ